MAGDETWSSSLLELFAKKRNGMKQKEALRVLQQGHNVLLTGAAGSGKTYVLEELTQWSRLQGRKVAVTATTGLAATNINGTTIHNWSGIGVRNRKTLLLPKTIPNIVRNMRPRFRAAIQNADILLIDEISTLHDYQLNAIDQIVRGIRNNADPFGNLQVILCGDFFQLPPINDTKGEKSGFITGSTAYHNGQFKVCYLSEIYRQIEGDLLTPILNAIRANRFNKDHLQQLRDRYKAPLQKLIVTTLCCSNKMADKINNSQLDQLTTQSESYTQLEEGDGDALNEVLKIFKDKVPAKLCLKVGAVVMFIKNDPQRKFFNGSLGKIVGFDDNHWPNVQLNKTQSDDHDGKILMGIQRTDFYQEDEEGKRLATIRQVPLRLAWAITINKSQGMTLDAARIDLSNAFVEGLGYVALSRVRSIDHLSMLGLNDIAKKINPIALHLEEYLQKASEETLHCLESEEE